MYSVQRSRLPAGANEPHVGFVPCGTDTLVRTRRGDAIGLPVMRDHERSRQEVLRGVRDTSRGVVPIMRRAERARRQVLRRVWDRPPCVGRRGRGRVAQRPHRRTPPGVDPVRGPRRVHAVVGVTRRRDGPRSPGPLLRDRDPDHRLLRRDDREVHRRRGHGRVGRTDRVRGRCRAGRPERARHGHRGRSTRARARGRAPVTGRRPHRRGRGDAWRDQPGDGRGRPRQHRRTTPVRGTARNRPRR